MIPIEITQKKDKLQAENILDILQIKQVRNEIYKRTKSERKTLFFRILLFIDSTSYWLRFRRI
jgi:hypothetical protein